MALILIRAYLKSYETTQIMTKQFLLTSFMLFFSVYATLAGDKDVLIRILQHGHAAEHKHDGTIALQKEPFVIEVT